MAGRRELRSTESRIEPGVALVLGAGGRAGLAYHAGTLLALQLHGVDIERPATLTGTSAGSLAAALLVGGVRAEDLSASSVGARPRAEFAEVEQLIRDAESGRPSIAAAEVARLFDPRRLGGAMSALARRNAVATVTRLLPGLVSLERRLRFLDEIEASPGAPPWRICAATEDGERRVLEGPAGTPIPAAVVAASCAVPTIYGAIEHAGERLVDGGVHSSTNADLADTDAASTVVVIAPMCGEFGSPLLRPARRALESEIELLRSKGRSVVVFTPTRQMHDVIGVNMLSGRRVREITRQAVLDAVDVIRTDPVLGSPSPVQRAVGRAAVGVFDGHASVAS